MILSAHQPVYLPWLGLFDKILQADTFCYFDDVQYQPKDFNNRNKIKLPNGQAHWLSVPVLRKNYLEKSFLEIEIDNKINWQRKHWKSISLSYAKAPYYQKYAKYFQKFYEVEWTHLAELNYEMLLVFLEVLGIKVRIVRMKDYQFKGEKSDLVLDMCKQLGASQYIFGEQGQNYAHLESFKEAQVEVIFQNYSHPIYPQINGEFLSHLSVLDLLFNCGPESKNILISQTLGKVN